MHVTKENPIEAVFKHIKDKTSDISQELFQKTPEDVDLKSDVVYPEDIYISVLKFNDKMIKDAKLNPLLDEYLMDLLSVRFSLDRKSRAEFTQVNTRPSASFQFPGEFDSVKEARK